MEHVEIFFKNHQYTIQFLSTLGTCAAVIVALWLAQTKTRPKLDIFVDTKVLVPSEAQQTGAVDWSKCEDGVGVTIRNVGQVIVYISYFSFYWGLPFPFRRRYAQQNPIPDFRKEGSLRLEPGTATSVMLTTDLKTFYDDVVLKLCEINNVPLFMRRFVRRFMMLRVNTDCGAAIKAKTGNNLKKLYYNQQRT